MSDSAIITKGTLLYISGSAAAAETLTSVVCGNPTIIGITGHAGVADGDVVTFSAGFTGVDAALLNSKVAVATHYSTGATNDTFAVDIDTTEKTITVGTATATPTAWIEVAELRDMKETPGTSADIECTDLKSTRKESRQGLPDSGGFTATAYLLDSDTGQAAMETAYGNQTQKSFKVTFPEGATPNRTFDGYVKQFPSIGDDITVDGVVKGTIEIKISGTVTKS